MPVAARFTSEVDHAGVPLKSFRHTDGKCVATDPVLQRCTTIAPSTSAEQCTAYQDSRLAWKAVAGWIRVGCLSREERRRWMKYQKIPDRLRGRDKADLRSARPAVVKGLSAHWFLHLAVASGRHCEKVCRCRPPNFPDGFQSSERRRSQCASMKSPAVCSPSCALMRSDATNARQLLYERVPTSIVASW